MSLAFVILACLYVHIVHVGDAKRIDKAQVTFSTNSNVSLQWEEFFDNESAKHNKRIVCHQMTFKIVEDEEVERCVRFGLFTRANMVGTELDINDVVQWKKSGFNPRKPTIILVHGFSPSVLDREFWMDRMKNALLRLADMNVVHVLWSPWSDHLYYPLVVENTIKIAGYLSRMIDLLVEAGANLKTIHIIGHSLGAHLAGMASYNMRRGVVGRITGLDPAGPLFARGNDATRLDSTDANFVDCIHTAHGIVGISAPICHADYYVNGGRIQPGCCEWVNVGRCGHDRSSDYFIESISNEKRFKAYSCAAIPDLDSVTCFDNGAVMGFPVNTSVRGIFYVETGLEQPFYITPPREKVEEWEAECYSTAPHFSIIDSVLEWFQSGP